MSEKFSSGTPPPLKKPKLNTLLGENGRVYCCLLKFFFPLEKFSLIWRRHHCRWKTANVDLCSALMTIEQWGFFSVPHLLWHGVSVYNGHLRGLVTPVAERLAVELLLPVFTNRVYRDRESNPDLPHTRRTLYLYATAAVWVGGCCRTVYRYFTLNS